MALADSGRVDGRVALPAAVVGMVSTRQVAAPGPDSARCGHGLGLGVCTEGGVRVLSHYGFRSGSGAVMTVLPEQRSAVVILANGPGAIMVETERTMLDILIGRRRTDAAADPEPAVGASLPPGIVGTYVSGADTLSLYVQSGSGHFRYRRLAPQAARLLSDGSVAVLASNGEVEQRFFVVRGRSGRLYLHDGLNAFRKVR
jgi:hypothetical protein